VVDNGAFADRQGGAGGLGRRQQVRRFLRPKANHWQMSRGRGGTERGNDPANISRRGQVQEKQQRCTVAASRGSSPSASTR